MPERNPMTAVGDTVTVAIPRGENGAVLFSCRDGSPAAAGESIIPELSPDEQATWHTVEVTKPGGAKASSLVSPEAGYCEAPGYTHARLRVATLTSGQVIGKTEWRKG